MPLSASELASGGFVRDADDRLVVVGPGGAALSAGIATELTLGKRFAGGKLSAGGTLNTAGDNIVLTPPNGQAVTVFWVSIIANPDDTASNLATVKFSNGTVLYVAYALAHWESFLGPVNGTLIINLSSIQTVGWTVHYTLA